jgi:hypothetical protein
VNFGSRLLTLLASRSRGPRFGTSTHSFPSCFFTWSGGRRGRSLLSAAPRHTWPCSYWACVPLGPPGRVSGASITANAGY